MSQNSWNKKKHYILFAETKLFLKSNFNFFSVQQESNIPSYYLTDELL